MLEISKIPKNEGAKGQKENFEEVFTKIFLTLKEHFPKLHFLVTLRHFFRVLHTINLAGIKNMLMIIISL